MANKATVKIRDRDLGYDEFRKNFKEWDGGVFVDVGLLARDAEKTMPEDEIVRKGIHNEFGHVYEDNTVPARPAHRTAFDARWREYLKMIEEELQANPVEFDPEAALKDVGQSHEDWLKDVIRDFSNPPNAFATVMKKGFDDPLIETGDMVDSVSHRVHDDRNLGE